MKKFVIIQLILLLLLVFISITLIQKKRVDEIHYKSQNIESSSNDLNSLSKKEESQNGEVLVEKSEKNLENIEKNIEENVDRVVNSGFVQEVYGFVFINNKKIKTKDEIKEGDVIKTAPHSYIIIKFNNDSIFRINPQSEVVIKTPNLKKESFSFEIVSGAILSHFKKKGKYNVYTKTAVIGVRGTTFYTNIDPKEIAKTELCACHGEINFDSENESFKKEIASQHHQEFILTPDGYITDEKTIKSIIPGFIRGHDDERIEYLEKILSENLPIVETSEPDYKLSENYEILKEALKLISEKKGIKAIAKLDSISRVDPYAMFLIGKILNDGIGIKKDTQAAQKWFKKSADLEFPSAIDMLK